MSILSDLNPATLEAKAGGLAVKILIVAAAVAGAYFYGHHNGVASETLVFNDYVSKKKAEAAQQVIANKDALAAQASKFNSQIAFIQQEHSGELAQISLQRDAALADSASSTEQLRSFLTRPRTSVKPAGVSGSGASAAGANGASGYQSLDGVSILDQWLIAQFSDFDATAATLNEAESVIAKDRETCNGALPGVTTK